MSELPTRLVDGYLSNELTTAEAEELHRQVSADPEVRAEFLALVRLERQLVAELGPIDLVGGVLDGIEQQHIESVMRVVRSNATRRRRRRAKARPAVLWVCGLAAGFALLVGAIWMFANQTTAPAAPQVVVSAQVGTPPALAISSGTLMRNGQRLAAGETVRADDEVTVGPESGGWLYPDGTVITADSGCIAIISTSGEGGKHIRVRRGSLTFSVAEQPMGRPLLVTTVHLQATVLGTRFTVHVADTSRLAVVQGRVQVQTATSTTILGASEEIHAGPRGAISSGWSLAGRWSQVVTAGTMRSDGPDTVVVAAPTLPAQRSVGFDATHYVCVQGGLGVGAVALTSLPDRFRLRLRMRSERAGNVQVTLESLTTPVTNHGSLHRAVTTEWVDAVFTASEFATDPSGQQIRTICVWSLDAGVVELSSVTIEPL